jgi:glycine/D-amino acid oxidase-like deaminating enzyme
MATTSRKTKIVIAGGGFAGLNAAMYLDRTLALEWEAWSDLEVEDVGATRRPRAAHDDSATTLLPEQPVPGGSRKTSC